jgi:hypothetical protein
MMFPLKSLTRWWELGPKFTDRSLDAYLPTNRREQEKGKHCSQAYLSWVAAVSCFSLVASEEDKGSLDGIMVENLAQMNTFHKM